MSGSTPRLVVRAHPTPRSRLALWHGRGPHEGHVLDRLAEALHEDGRTVVTAHWNYGDPDRGRGALQASLEEAASLAADVPLVIVGWSLGGTAALSVAFDEGSPWRPAAVVGLAADPTQPSPWDGSVPLERARQGVRHRPPPIYLLHGRADTVVPAAAAVEFVDACSRSSVSCALSLLDSDHAGVIGTRYDPDRRACVPSDEAAAVTGLQAAVHAVRHAVNAPGQ